MTGDSEAYPKAPRQSKRLEKVSLTVSQPIGGVVSHASTPKLSCTFLWTICSSAFPGLRLALHPYHLRFHNLIFRLF